MKKKILAFICMITCIFGLTACATDENLSSYDSTKLAEAAKVASEYIVPVMFEVNEMADSLVADDIDFFKDLTPNEISFWVEQTFQLDMDGFAVITAAESFRSAMKDIGDFLEVGEANAEFEGSTIVVSVDVIGTEADAVAEVVLSSDLMIEPLKVQSVALNPIETMGGLMTQATMNTVIGMGVVFSVLILISFVISAFKLIGKIGEKKPAAKKEAPKANVSAPAPAPAVPAVEVVDMAAEYELVAVIAAAIAAHRGESDTDGFVVRSVIRRR